MSPIVCCWVCDGDKVMRFICGCCYQRAELQHEKSEEKISADDVRKLSSEYNNAANLSRDYRSTSNVVQLEGMHATLRYASYFAYDMICNMCLKLLREASVYSIGIIPTNHDRGSASRMRMHARTHTITCYGCFRPPPTNCLMAQWEISCLMRFKCAV